MQAVVQLQDDVWIKQHVILITQQLNEAAHVLMELNITIVMKLFKDSRRSDGVCDAFEVIGCTDEFKL